MKKLVIYYQAQKYENTDSIVEKIDCQIMKLENTFLVKGVFIDEFNECKKFNELIELIHDQCIDIDILVINKPIKDEFDRKLIIELSRAEEFEIKLFQEV